MTDVHGGPVGPIEGISARGLQVGSYSRRMSVSLARMYENALDWEHLPHLHSGAFCAIEMIEAGDWGWRAKVGLGPKGDVERDDFIVLQLHLDRKRHRWISSTLAGPGAGSEIWTHVFDLGSGDIEVLVDFFIPTNNAAERERTGRYYESLYARLYDEDEAMMVERQRQLDNRSRSSATESSGSGSMLSGRGEWLMGSMAQLRPQLPLRFKHNDREFRLLDEGEELLVHATLCPHQLGPLGQADAVNGTVECPWHGYQFDIRSGRCLTGQSCQLPRAPMVFENANGDIIVRD